MPTRSTTCHDAHGRSTNYGASLDLQSKVLKRGISVAAAQGLTEFAAKVILHEQYNPELVPPDVHVRCGMGWMLGKGRDANSHRRRSCGSTGRWAADEEDSGSRGAHRGDDEPLPMDLEGAAGEGGDSASAALRLHRIKIRAARKEWKQALRRDEDPRRVDELWKAALTASQKGVVAEYELEAADDADFEPGSAMESSDLGREACACIPNSIGPPFDPTYRPFVCGSCEEDPVAAEKIVSAGCSKCLGLCRVCTKCDTAVHTAAHYGCGVGQTSLGINPTTARINRMSLAELAAAAELEEIGGLPPGTLNTCTMLVYKGKRSVFPSFRRPTRHASLHPHSPLTLTSCVSRPAFATAALQRGEAGATAAFGYPGSHV